MNSVIPIALLGFGNVGTAFAKLLLKKGPELEREYGISWKVVGIATKMHGIAIDYGGIKLTQALGLIKEDGDLSDLNSVPPPEDVFKFIEKCNAQVLFETTPVNYETGQPAVEYLQRGLESGMHVITANKGPVVHAYQPLSSFARSKNLHFYFESTVMDGAPIFSLWRDALPGGKLISFRGVLNSTSNLILTLMEDGSTFEDAVKEAQRIGIAETDPSGDIDGWDSAVKVAALVTVLMNTPTTPVNIARQGIRGISEKMVQTSLKNGKRWKLICEARRENGRIKTAVYPSEIEPTDSLYNVRGTSSSITFESDVLGALTILEQDPGPETTAYGLLADFINAVRGK